MNFRKKSFTSLGKRIFPLIISLFAFAFFLSFQEGASAIPAIDAPPTPEVVPNQALPPASSAESAVPETPIVLPKILEDARLYYERLVSEANSAIDDVSTQLASPVPDEKIIGERQDDLEHAADKLDDLAEKVTKYGKKLYGLGGGDLSRNLQAFRQTLDNAAQSIDRLADDTERAKEGASPLLKARIDRGIAAVKQSLQGSDRALEDLLSTVKAGIRSAA
ncbi:hypothetical protein V0288_11660 [Pannus brasiliensis CCIBt3594]|uniref:Uncharacterized protein n=1 Tax=Pannus brasiliensis CCIBt3594 TaxID=1427578 RepID=A0AAW9QV22_9CHRO